MKSFSFISKVKVNSRQYNFFFLLEGGGAECLITFLTTVHESGLRFLTKQGTKGQLEQFACSRVADFEKYCFFLLFLYNSEIKKRAA